MEMIGFFIVGYFCKLKEIRSFWFVNIINECVWRVIFLKIVMCIKCKWYWGWFVYLGIIFLVYLLFFVDFGSLFLVVDLVVGILDKMEVGFKWIVFYKDK